MHRRRRWLDLRHREGSAPGAETPAIHGHRSPSRRTVPLAPTNSARDRVGDEILETLGKSAARIRSGGVRSPPRNRSLPRVARSFSCHLRKPKPEIFLGQIFLPAVSFEIPQADFSLDGPFPSPGDIKKVNHKRVVGLLQDKGHDPWIPAAGEFVEEGKPAEPPAF